MNYILLALGWFVFALAFAFDDGVRLYLNGAAAGLFLGALAVSIEVMVKR